MDHDDFFEKYRIFQQAWEAADDTGRHPRVRRPVAGWLKRVTVCWWKHRTRKLGAGMYVSHACWACAGA